MSLDVHSYGRLYDNNAPGMLDGARLDADQLLPDGTQDRSHTVRSRRYVDVLAEVAYPVHRANDSRGT